MRPPSVDWDAGQYERTAEEIEPVAHAVVHMAAVGPEEAVLDVACGTGNAALLAAERGAHVVGIDRAPRLLDVARMRARARGLDVDFRQGNLLDLPVRDGTADIVLSVFGVIFAEDPSRAMAEIARAARSNARVFITAWMPSGPIDEMLAAVGRIVASVARAAPPSRFPWSDGAAVRALAAGAGLALHQTTAAELAIRDSSPEAYITSGQQHPMAVATRPLLERAGLDAEALAAMTAVLRKANEDPAAFLVHSPYVIHELRRD